MLYQYCQYTACKSRPVEQRWQWIYGYCNMPEHYDYICKYLLGGMLYGYIWSVMSHAYILSRHFDMADLVRHYCIPYEALDNWWNSDFQDPFVQPYWHRAFWRFSKAETYYGLSYRMEPAVIVPKKTCPTPIIMPCTVLVCSYYIFWGEKYYTQSNYCCCSQIYTFFAEQAEKRGQTSRRNSAVF